MIVFDFETTNLDYGSALNPDNRILMVSWLDTKAGDTVIFSGDIMKAREFWKALSGADTVCAYNAKFEQHWLLRLGFDIDSVQWHDPMLAERVLLGNKTTPKGYLTLGEVCQRYGLDAKDTMIDTLMKEGVCPSEMPQARLMQRCLQDTRTTHELLQKQVKLLKDTNRLHIYRNRCQFTPVLTHIEGEGMLLDPSRVIFEYNTYSKLCAEIDGELAEITGGINMNSPDQKAKFLYTTLKFPERKDRRGRALRNKPSKQFPKGRPKTDKATLAWLSTQCKTPRQKNFIELSQKYSVAHAALSKNLEFFYGVCVEGDCTFRAKFNQIVAATHRLSSSGSPIYFKRFDKRKSVQFQNMPRVFKRCFQAPTGYKIVECDAMQLEFRVAAYLGQCKQALSDIADPNFDAHIFSASKIYGLGYDKLLADFRGENGDDSKTLAKMYRQTAKPHTFKPLYGGTKGTPGEEAYYAEFTARYKGVAATQQQWLAEVMMDDELVLPWGMRFYWKTYTKNGVAFCARTHKPVGPQVYNYPVQNLATAEIVPIAICALWRRCKEAKLDVKFVNTVHDSVICYVADGDIEAFSYMCKLAFTEDVYEYLDAHYGIKFTVPLGCELVVGDHWGEGTESVYDDVRKDNG